MFLFTLVKIVHCAFALMALAMAPGLSALWSAPSGQKFWSHLKQFLEQPSNHGPVLFPGFSRCCWGRSTKLIKSCLEMTDVSKLPRTLVVNWQLQLYVFRLVVHEQFITAILFLRRHKLTWLQNLACHNHCLRSRPNNVFTHSTSAECYIVFSYQRFVRANDM